MSRDETCELVGFPSLNVVHKTYVAKRFFTRPVDAG
jgi:hypothetical protein